MTIKKCILLIYINKNVLKYYQNKGRKEEKLMKLSELKILLNKVNLNIKLLEDFENVELTRFHIKKTELYNYQKEKEFKERQTKLPKLILEELINCTHTQDEKQLKNNFFPSNIFENRDEWQTILIISESLEQYISEYRMNSFLNLLTLQENLQYVIKKEKYPFLKFIQSQTTRNKLNTAYQEIELHSKEVVKLEENLSNWKKLINSDSSSNQLEYFYHHQKEYFTQLINQLGILSDSNSDYILETLHLSLNKKLRHIKKHSKMGLSLAINNTWDEIKEKDFNRQSQSYPIELLENTNIQIERYFPNLSKHFKFLMNIKNSSNEHISKLCAIPLEDVLSIKKVVANILQSSKLNFFPKLSVDTFSEHEYKLINLLTIYQAYPIEKEKLEQKIVLELESLIAALKQLEATTPNRLQLNFQTDERRDSWLNAESELYKRYAAILREYSFEDRVEDILDKDKLIELFIENNATYYALIEETTGSKKKYIPNDLPSIIVEKVKQNEINRLGLKVVLRSYQTFGVQYVLHYKNVLLGDEMGLGKTIQAIAIANHLFHNKKIYTVVVCPLSVLENWDREIQKWSTLPTFVYRGNLRQTLLHQWQQNGGVLLTNYEQVKTLLTSIRNKNIDFLIIDEAHYIKNPNTMRTKYSMELSKLADYKLFMSGTPLENRFSEMLHLINMLNPALANKLESRYHSSKDLKIKLSTIYLRRKRKEVLDELPELETIELWSQFTPIQQQFYDESLLDGPGGIMRMRRAAFFGNDSKKILQILEICKEAKETGQKVIIFSFFKEGVLYRLQDELKHLARFIISGDISPKQRQETIDEFSKDPNQTVLLSQIDAGGVGLNIQATNIVILCEPQWKPSTEQQAISRVYRMGQSRKVIVYRLLTEESIDESIVKLLSEKIELFNKYANDSSIAEAFEKSEVFEISNTEEKKIKQEVFELEKKRLALRKSNSINSNSPNN
ncbi:TPA: DEAD/DEAH box helicase [Streptococcus suis]|nr:DEAD/DEAH box helicase [Streptococcus suis]